MSFKDATIDFSEKKNTPKHLAVIYGENGSGKTSVINAMTLLSFSIRQIEVQRNFEQMIINKVPMVPEQIPFTMDSLYQHFHMIESTGPLSLTFEFMIQDKVYRYAFAYKNGLLVQESLDFALEKNTVNVYRYQNNTWLIHHGLFNNEALYHDMVEVVHRFEGKTSFLCLAYESLLKYNKDYVDANVNPGLVTFVNAIYQMNVLGQGSVPSSLVSAFSSSRYNGVFNTPHGLLKQLMNGALPVKEKKRLDITQDVLGYYLKALIADIRDVHYRLKEKEGLIYYDLFIHKMISGKIREIPATQESTGIQKLISLFAPLLNALNGDVVFIDELDTGTHTGLLLSLFENIKTQIKGQLIATTHNVLLLDALKPAQCYVIDINHEGNRLVYSLDKMSPHIQPHHDVSGRYIKGFYGGAPYEIFLNAERMIEKVRGE